MSTPRWFLFASGLLLLNTLLVIAAGYRRHAAADEPHQVTTEAASPTTSRASADLDPPSLAHTATSPEGLPTSPTDPQAQLDALPVPAQLPDAPELADLEALKNDPGFQEFRRLFEQAEESWESEPPLLAPSSEATSRDAEPRDALPRDALPRDALPRDALPRDAGPRDAEPRAEAAPRNGSRASPFGEGPFRDSPFREGPFLGGNSRTGYFQALDQRLESVEALCSVARSLARQAAEQEERGSHRQSQELLRMTTQLRDLAAKLLVSEM